MGLSLVMALIAIVGFWPRYFGPLVFGTLVQPLLVHIHATVFTGWLLLFFLQALLLERDHQRRLRHRRRLAAARLRRGRRTARRAKVISQS